MNELGMFDVTTDRLESPRMKFACNPHLSGKGGGHEINLHQLNRDGVILLGYLDAASKGKIMFMPNLAEKLEDVDRFANNFKKQVDIHIRKHQLSFPRSIYERSDGDNKNFCHSIYTRGGSVLTWLFAWRP